MNKVAELVLRKTGVYYYVLPKYIRFSFWRHHGRFYKTVHANGLVCNVCSHAYEKFVPSFPAPEDKAALDKFRVYAGYSQNDFCPHCMSTCRERLVIAVLQNKIDISNKKILHLAPEKTIYDFLKNKSNVITVDYVPERYRHVDRKIFFADINKLGFNDNEFDIVIANHILEHIPDDRTALREIYRVLKPGGRAILQIPYSLTIETTLEDASVQDPRERSRRFGQCDHVRIYSLTDYINRLENAGFSVDILDEADLKAYKQNAFQPGEKFLVIKKPVRKM